MFPSVNEKSSYSTSLDLIGKGACDYRGWQKWGPPGSPADAPESLHPTIRAKGNSLPHFPPVFLGRDECNNAGWSDWRSIMGCLIGAKAR